MHLPLVPVRELTAGDVPAIRIHIDVGVITDKVPMDASFQTFE